MRVAIENRYFVLDGGLDLSMEREITPPPAGGVSVKSFPHDIFIVNLEVSVSCLLCTVLCFYSDTKSVRPNTLCCAVVGHLQKLLNSC